MPATRRSQAERRATSERTLLRVAARLIAERRSTQFTFAELAREAGCSHGLPHYLFGSKVKMLEALVHELADRVGTHMLVPAVGTATGRDALLAALRAAVGNLEHPNESTTALWVLVGEAIGSSPELQPALADYHASVLARLRALLEAARDAGDVRADLDTDAYATVVLATIRGLGVLRITNPDTFTPAIATTFIATVERAL